MKIGLTLGCLLLGGAATLLGQLSAEAVPGGKGGTAGGGIGADVAVCTMPSIYRWGTTGGVTGYSVATTSVNLGDVDLEWYGYNSRHPRIPQNMFKHHNGRLTQIGMSWCKDGFCALQENQCGSCDPAGFGCPELLGPGCSDPYSDSLNGQQSNLAPRSQCNAASGDYLYPPENLTSPTATIGRRVQVLQNELSPSSNPGATYYCDSIYLHPQDYESGNQANNSSFREMTVGTLSSSGYRLTPTGPTSIGKPGIFAWQDNSKSVVIRTIDIPNDGQVFLASDVIDNGDGTYRYEYAIYNLTSDYNINGLEIPVPANATVTDIGFSDVNSHSGEPFAINAWAAFNDGDAIVWNTSEYATDENANSIRWGTMYNFFFTCDAAPVEGSASLEVFRTNSSVTALDIKVPGGSANPFDLNGDACVDGGDVGIFITQWGQSGGIADFNTDGIVDSGDLGMLISSWGC